MLGQKQEQGHSSSVNQNVNMGTSQGLSLLLQGLPCIPKGMLQPCAYHQSVINKHDIKMHIISKQGVDLLQ